MKELAVALALTVLVQAVLSLTVYSPAVLAPVAQADVGIDASSIGIFTAIIYAMATWCAPWGSTFVARQGPIRVSQYCLIFCGCGIALCALGHPLAVVAGAVLIGCGSGPVTPASSEILSTRTPDRMRNLVISIRQSGITLGGAVSGVLAPGLLRVAGWQVAAVAIGAFCLCCAAGLEAVRGRYDVVRKEALSVTRPTLMQLLSMVFAQRELRQNALGSFIYAGVQHCLASFLVVFLTERAALSLVQAGAALSAAMIGGLIGRVGWGIIADSIGSSRIVLGALGIVMALCSLVMSQVGPGWPLAAIFVLNVVFGATAIGWNGIYVAEIVRVARPGEVAIATGGSLIFTYFGIVVGPLLFWIVITVTGSYAWAFVLLGFATLPAALGYLRKSAAGA